MVFGPDDELAPVRDFDSVDDESVVVSDVPLHVLDALPQLNVVVVPRDGGGGEGDDPAGEPGRVALHGEGGGGLDDEPGGGALPVYQDLLHPVLLHLELPQRAELGQAAQGKDELVPVGILLANLLPGWNKKRV